MFNFKSILSKLYSVSLLFWQIQTHSNPCFLRKDGGIVPMIKDQKKLMENDETFGLLRDRLFFKVMYDVPNGTTKRSFFF